jgi:hypothetical protein
LTPHPDPTLAGSSAANSPRPLSRDALGPLREHDNRGVNVFYVISGFILGLPFAAHELKRAAAVSLKPFSSGESAASSRLTILNILICFALLVFMR